MIKMLVTGQSNGTGQIEMVSINDLVPEDHLVRKVTQVMDFSFVYALVRERYSKDNGRPSIDPVVLVKMVLIQYLFGIRSMRQTVKEIEVSVAYRWFLGLGLSDSVPYFTTFGKNYKRRFEGSGLI
jgi:transposase